MKKVHYSCEEYCNYDDSTKLHDIDYEHIANNLLDGKQHLIISGPEGIGKYTQSLQILRCISPSKLKYERKMTIEFNKNIYNFTLSDVHLEVDFDMLGCQSRLLWHEIYSNYVDTLVRNKRGIILCKNFHSIHGELHEIFYSYMHDINTKYNVKYMIHTNSVSFIYNNILNKSRILTLQRPTKSKYQKLTRKKLANNNVINIKNVIHQVVDRDPCHALCDVVCDYLEDMDNFELSVLREHIYNLFVYNLNIHNCIWYINTRFQNHTMYKKYAHKIIKETAVFFKFFNNNYRPIYHLESYLIFLFHCIHDLETENKKYASIPLSLNLSKIMT